MKKILLIASMAVLSMNVALWSASITINSPNSGMEWCIGSSYTITWASSGVTGAVDVILRQTGNPAAPPVLGIAAATANDGTAIWTIPASVAPGNYLVRIRSVNSPEVFDDSDDFEIKECVTPSISVTNPHGSTWYIGEHYTIQWTSTNVPAGNVHIILRLAGVPDSPPVLAIATNTANDGTEGWTIPNTVTRGDYLIRIRTVSESPYVFDDSSDFHIGKKTDPGILEKLKRKRYWEIKWPPDPDPPCLCPEWKIPDLRDFREFLGGKFAGSIVLMKNGAKLQELARFGGKRTLPGSVKANLGRQDFNLLKNGGAKFSIAILDGNGSILNESALEQGSQEQLLR